MVLIAWGAIVLVSWAFFVLVGQWQRGVYFVPTSLPLSGRFHLYALAGATLGTLVALWARRPASRPERPLSVDWWRVTQGVAVIVALLGTNFYLADRPLAALWRLGGPLPYTADLDQASALHLLDNVVTGGVVILLVAAAVRRLRQVRPPVIELALLVVLGLLALGSGFRARLYLLVIGWLLLQLGPALARPSLKRWTIIVAGFVLLIAALSTAGVIAENRVINPANVGQSTFRVALTGTDVVGPAEILLQRGARPGVLAEHSYTELPGLLVPRLLFSKGSPSSDQLMRFYVSPTAGFAAPLWFEAVLNFGAAGAFVFMLVWAWASVALIERSRASARKAFRCVALFGPSWILVQYMVLSRLTLFQAIADGLIIALGFLLASRAIRWRPESNI